MKVFRPRRWRWFLLRGRRTLSRHYPTTLTAVVLILVLLASLTDGRILNPTDSPEPADAMPDVMSGLPAQSAPASGSVIYYLVGSVEEIQVLSAAVRSDRRYALDYGPPLLPRVWVHFMLFDTPAREAEGARYLNLFAEMAHTEGLSFRVIDLTD